VHDNVDTTSNQGVLNNSFQIETANKFHLKNLFIPIFTIKFSIIDKSIINKIATVFSINKALKILGKKL